MNWGILVCPALVSLPLLYWHSSPSTCVVLHCGQLWVVVVCESPTVITYVSHWYLPNLCYR